MGAVFSGNVQCAVGDAGSEAKSPAPCDPQLPGKYGCGRHPAAQRNVALQRECVLLHFSRHGPGARRLWRGVNVIAVAGSVEATPIRAWPHIRGCSCVKEATGILRRFEKEGQKMVASSLCCKRWGLATV